MALCPEHDLRGIALCAGVGGLELGLHIAEPGYRTVCFVEREAYAAATLVARMEDQTLDHAPVWDDVAAFDGRPWRGRVHLVSGGYPCQPFSYSGKRQGAADERHLWPQVRRIVGEVGPAWCFFENVEGHLDMGAAEVFEDLRGMGYAVKAGLFSALEVGASHLRRRLFILAHADPLALLQPRRAGAVGRGHEVPQRPDADRPAGGARQGGEAVDDDVPDRHRLRRSAEAELPLPLFAPAPFEFGRWAEILARRPELQPELLGLADGMADRMDRAFAAGNGVVSLAAAYAFRTLKNAHLGETVGLIR